MEPIDKNDLNEYVALDDITSNFVTQMCKEIDDDILNSLLGMVDRPPVIQPSDFELNRLVNDLRNL